MQRHTTSRHRGRVFGAFDAVEGLAVAAGSGGAAAIDAIAQKYGITSVPALSPAVR